MQLIYAGQVEWSTWGSKLESIFQPVFSTLPSLVVSVLHYTVMYCTVLHCFMPYCAVVL